MARIAVVIPVRKGGSPTETLASLARQTFRDFAVTVVSDEEEKGACWARNRGMERTDSPLLLFSDDDVKWERGAFLDLVSTLDANPEASYSYGSFRIDGRDVSNVPFSANLLRKQNFVSTMALVRREHHPGWDESLRRLQDYDVYLTMLERGRTGVYCGKRIFSTTRREGITYGGISYRDAMAEIRRKHGNGN